MDFLKSKFDNLCLFVLLIIMMALLLHMSHDKADADLVAWVEQALTTVLGAYIGLTQAHRIPWPNKNGGTNGSTKVSAVPDTPATPAT